MEFANQTGLPAAWTLGFLPDGREQLLVVVKATFSLPSASDRATKEAPSLRAFAEAQVPLTKADTFTGEPGLSAPLYESDFAHLKQRCDILFCGKAWSPQGRPQPRIGVLISVGNRTKKFCVLGPRFWRKRVLGLSSTDPEPFLEMPFSYDNAFGGSDASDQDPSDVKTYLENPVGRGFAVSTKKLEGMPLPNTEEIRQPITSPRGRYRPQALGPLGRNWQPRSSFAGTYDEAWLDRRAPFWPGDFDPQFFQAAPPDQQCPFLNGGEEVVLVNLTRAGRTSFVIPRVPMPILFLPYRGADQLQAAVIDTLVIEPELHRYTLTWRTSLPLRRNCFEIRQIVVGETSRSWHHERRARALGKRYFRGLNDFVRNRAGQR